MRAYKTHIKRIPPSGTLVEIIEKQKQTDQWKRGFITNPATWINQGRWDDDIQAMNEQAVAIKKPQAVEQAGTSYKEFEPDPEMEQFKNMTEEERRENARRARELVNALC